MRIPDIVAAQILFLPRDDWRGPKNPIQLKDFINLPAARG
jgi:hypothetical protein